MKKRHKLIWKLYCIVFSVIALARLTALLHPELDPYIFYHILMAWSHFFKIHYFLALTKSAMTVFCLYPLWAFAFNRESSFLRFWQWILVIRLMLEFVGNYYEFVLVKASFHMVVAYGLSVTGVVLLPLLPSYIGHFAYAFPTNPDNNQKAS